jgi:hypothetical protein
MTSVVLDTSVLVIANGRAEHVDVLGEQACIDALVAAQGLCICLDSGERILDEYERYCSRRGQPGVGDAFFRWLVDHQWREERCVRVAITPHAEREFAEFPADPSLAQFDRSDRKFVAVALASRRQPTVQVGVDRGWARYAATLADHGVQVQILCG